MKKFNSNSIITAFVLSFVFGLTGVVAAATAVNLGTANNFAVLAGSTITNTGTSVINGDLGLSPGTSVTGFPPGVLNGTQYVANAAAVQWSMVVVFMNSFSRELGCLRFVSGLLLAGFASALLGSVTSDGITFGWNITSRAFDSPNQVGLYGRLRGERFV